MKSNSVTPELDVVIKNSIIDPDRIDNSVRFYKIEKSTYYKVWIFIDGRDLPYVDYVVYYLHESFRQPVRKILRTPSNPNCSLITWTWGTFVLRADIVDKKGNTFKFTKDLDWDKELTTDRKYIEDKNLSY